MFLDARSSTRELVGNGIEQIYKLSKERKWEIFLFGGVPRSTWMGNGPVRVRDFDLVISENHFDEFIYSFSEFIVKRNRFGGVKLVIDNIEFDIWSLESTWAFKNKLVEPAAFEMLPETVFLNIDSIVVELAPKEGFPRRIFQSGFYRAIKNKDLDICLLDNPFPDLSALRSLKMAQTFQFSISRPLANYISQTIKDYKFKDLQKTQLHHYGRIIFESQDLINFTEKIDEGLDNSKLDRINIFGARVQQEFDFSCFSFSKLKHD